MKGAERVANEIGGAAIECNVADVASTEKAFDAARNAVGAARVLVNCAGIGSGELLVKKDGTPSGVDLFLKTVAVNLFGTFNCIRLGAAEMTKLAPLADDERGVIVNTTSVAAYEGQIGQIAYSASKGGVVGLTLPAARELGRYGIRVMTIAPGYIATPLLDAVPETLRARCSRRRCSPTSASARPTIRAALPVDHREPDAERLGDPARRGNQHAAEVTICVDRRIVIVKRSQGSLARSHVAAAALHPRRVRLGSGILRCAQDDAVRHARYEGDIPMLQLRPDCECCDRDLPPDSREARICSFECTFCAPAPSVLKGAARIAAASWCAGRCARPRSSRNIPPRASAR